MQKHLDVFLELIETEKLIETARDIKIETDFTDSEALHIFHFFNDYNREKEISDDDFVRFYEQPLLEYMAPLDSVLSFRTTKVFADRLNNASPNRSEFIVKVLRTYLENEG